MHINHLASLPITVLPPPKHKASLIQTAPAHPHSAELTGTNERNDKANHKHRPFMAFLPATLWLTLLLAVGLVLWGCADDDHGGPPSSPSDSGVLTDTHTDDQLDGDSSHIDDVDESDAEPADPDASSTPCSAPMVSCSDQCVDTMVDNAHCGGCHIPCQQGEQCEDGECLPACDEPETLCDGHCVDLQSDPENCGECELACPDNNICSLGSCVTICDTGMLLCGDECVDPNSSHSHCGACDKPCTPDQICQGGSCIPQCSEGTVKCGNTCANLNSDREHCGICNHKCPEGSECHNGECGRSVTHITLDPAELTLPRGRSHLLTPTIIPADALNKSVVWLTSNKTIATVEPDGNVTALAVGTAIITASTVDGGHMATCRVTVTVAVEEITITSESIQLTPGSSQAVSYYILPGDASNKGVTWSSTNPQVAMVDESGLVTGITNGQTTIKVTTVDGGFTDECQVSVSEIPVTGLSLRPFEITVVKGRQSQLVATVTPANATNKSLFWISADPSIASVNTDGLVTGLKTGSTVVSVFTADGSHTASCNVTVTVPVTFVTISLTELTLEAGDTKQLIATVIPADATIQTISWTTNNPGVATVTEDGLVTTVDSGVAIITATTVDGGYFAECEVTVWEIPITSITLEPSTLYIPPGSNGSLTIIVEPPNATQRGFQWESDSERIATVVPDGPKSAVVSGITFGETVIRVKDHKGTHLASCPVGVRTVATHVVLDHDTIELGPNESAELTATVHPPEAHIRSVTWSSSDEETVTVTATGPTTATITTAPEASGTAIITVTTEDRGFTATCTVRLHKWHQLVFTDTGDHSFRVPANVTSLTALVVAGGGGGSTHNSGGGGAGGLIYREEFPVTPGETLPIKVGAGGSRDTNVSAGTDASNGEDSHLGTLIAKGGGRGGSWDNGMATSGGSGGGAGCHSSNTYQPGDGVAGQGSRGGDAKNDGEDRSGGGGGGAGAPGERGQSSRGGNGGDGLYFGDIFGDEYGDDGWFAGGGGGVHRNASETVSGVGGKGGGGDGRGLGDSLSAKDGMANTGGGGGAKETSSTANVGLAGNGGSGIVIIRYLTGDNTE